MGRGDVANKHSPYRMHAYISSKFAHSQGKGRNVFFGNPHHADSDTATRLIGQWAQKREQKKTGDLPAYTIHQWCLAPKQASYQQAPGKVPCTPKKLTVEFKINHPKRLYTPLAHHLPLPASQPVPINDPICSIQSTRPDMQATDTHTHTPTLRITFSPSHFYLSHSLACWLSYMHAPLTPSL